MPQLRGWKEELELPETKSLTLGDCTLEKRSKLGGRIIVRKEEGVEAHVRCWKEVRIATHPLDAERRMGWRLKIAQSADGRGF